MKGSRSIFLSMNRFISSNLSQQLPIANFFRDLNKSRCFDMKLIPEGVIRFYPILKSWMISTDFHDIKYVSVSSVRLHPDKLR